jgi:hypothetical protein
MTNSASTLTAVPVRVDADGVVLSGDLNIPTDAQGLVVFSHGSGSSRFSPRNRAVADVLLHAGRSTGHGLVRHAFGLDDKVFTGSREFAPIPSSYQSAPRR